MHPGGKESLRLVLVLRCEPAAYRDYYTVTESEEEAGGARWTLCEIPSVGLTYLEVGIIGCEDFRDSPISHVD